MKTHYFVPVLFVLSLLLFQFAFAAPYTVRINPFVDRVGDKRTYSTVGSPFLYGLGEHVINQFDIAGISFANSIWFNVRHNLTNRFTHIEFQLKVVPIELYELTSDEPHFWGNLSDFQFLINGDEVSDLQLVREGSVYSRFSGNNTEYYNFIARDYYLEYFEDPYSMKTLTFQLQYSFNIYSNHTNFVSSLQEELIGTSRPVDFRINLFVTSPTATGLLFWGSLILLLATTFVVISWMSSFPGRRDFTRFDLILQTKIYPHLLIIAPMVLLTRWLYVSTLTTWQVMIAQGLLYLLFGIVPILIEVLTKNYVYKGISTNPSQPIFSQYLGDVTQSAGLAIPNSIRVIQAGEYTAEKHQRVLQLNDERVLEWVALNSVLAAFLIYLIVAFGGGLFPLFLYLPWIYFRKIRVNLKTPRREKLYPS